MAGDYDTIDADDELSSIVHILSAQYFPPIADRSIFEFRAGMPCLCVACWPKMIAPLMARSVRVPASYTYYLTYYCFCLSGRLSLTQGRPL